MPFNIQEFKSRGLLYGGARPTQFEVWCNMPPNIGTNAAEKLRFVCQAASLPSFIVQPVIVPYFGREIKFSGDRIFNDWQVTIMNDEDFTVRNAFEAWSNAMNTLISNRLDPELWPTDYKQYATVVQYGKDGTPVRKYNFWGLFPSQVDNIGLQWDAVNQIESFGVNFSFDYFELDEDVFSDNLEDETYSAVLEGDNEFLDQH